jgi:hypothetical protein
MSDRKIKSLLQVLCVSALVIISSHSVSAQTFVFRVTDTFLKADNPQSGRCPATVTFHGYITANGPGTVRYTIAHSIGPGVPHDAGTREMIFTAAGTQRISTTWTFSDLGTASHYDGWEAIRILSPTPMESSHVTGAFSLNCPVPLQAAVNRPSLATLAGNFLVTLNGFHVNRQTRDDPLELDGSGDEIFIRDADFIIDATGHVNNYSFGGSGTRSTIIHSHSGDSFPSGAPVDDARLTLSAGIPHFYYQGEIVQGEKALVLFPVLWEWDSDNEAPRFLGDQFLTMARDRHLVDYVTRFLSSSPGTSPGDFIKTGSEIGLPLGVTLSHGPLGLGEPGNRPIGMIRRDAESYVFDPKVLILTYQAADLISRTDFGHGPGIFEMRFQDDHDLEGDYTLFLQVKRLP